MQYPHEQPPGMMNVEQWENLALNVIEFLTSVVCMPVEIILRPWYGSRYFSVAVIFFSAVMMILLPAFGAFASGVATVLPLAHRPVIIGLFSIGSLSKLYFFLSFFHGFRVWRRMIHMEIEQHSHFEGPPLPVFRLLPGKSFWFIRIVLEPGTVFMAATIGGNLLIFQSGLVTFLHLAALALLIKCFIGWYREWQYLRDLLDMRNAGPIIGKLVHDQASDEELAQVHIASFPKNIAPDLKQAAIDRIAHLFSVRTNS
jgi:hypothetical protein